MQNRREVNQDGLRPFALCAVNCKKGSLQTFSAAQDAPKLNPFCHRQQRPFWGHRLWQGVCVRIPMIQPSRSAHPE